MKRRQVLAAVPGLGLIVVTAACSGLPSSGPVTPGRRLDEQQQQVIRVSPQTPVQGASKTDIVRGFLRAAEDLDDTRPAAQKYLTPGGVERWTWTSEDVYVFDTEDDLTVTESAGDRVRATVPAVARVDPSGRYEDLARRPISLDLQLLKISGEWRIDLDQPYGLWLSATAFERLYVARAIHYVSSRDALLVPDVRWFPRTEARLATALARAQLDRVPPYLSGPAVSAFPTGTRLAVNAVPVEGRVATVELTEAAQGPDPRQRAAMFAQMFQTLDNVDQVDAVSMSAAGVPLEIAGLGRTVSDLAQVGFTLPPFESYPTLLVRDPDENVFVRVDPRLLDADSGTAPAKPGLRQGDPTLIPGGWAYLAMSFDGTQVAAVGGDGRDLSRWAGDVLPFARFASALGRPAFDTAGNIWVSGIDARGSTRLFLVLSGSADPEITPRTVAVPWLGGARVTSLAFAADGVRVLVVSTDASGRSFLHLSSVVRDSFGVPSSLAPGWRQAATLVDLRDVVWTGSQSFAVLGRSSTEDPFRPWTATVGMGLDGVRRSAAAPALLAPVAQARSLTTLGGSRGLVVLTDDHRVLFRAGSIWRELRRGNAVLVPGR